MREIKFRAWRAGDGGCMEYGHYVVDHATVNWFNFSESVSAELVLMQFTGFLDCDGKEIYEGDVIEDSFDGIQYVIRWDTDGFWGCYAIVDPDRPLRYEKDADNAPDKVIGNIYENPDLLNQYA